MSYRARRMIVRFQQVALFLVVVLLRLAFGLQTADSSGGDRRRTGRHERRQRALPKLALPLPFISAVVASSKAENPIQAVPVFFETLQTEQQKNTALPEAQVPFAQLRFCEDSLAAQGQARSRMPPPPFLEQLTPQMCLNIDDDNPNNDNNVQQQQLQWLQENADQVRQMRQSHGAVYFRSWSLFQTAAGVKQAIEALGLVPCRDPKEIRGPAPLLSGSSTVCETLNNPSDAATHLGLHYEGIPGIMPTSALFSCFQPATMGGGEFLLCDGRGVVRDSSTQTLEHLHQKKLRPTFAQLPDWLATSPLSSILPFTNVRHRELLALLTDMLAPTEDFFLGVFPADKNDNNDDKDDRVSLKLTTHAALPLLHHPITGEPVWFSGMDAGHQGNFQRNNPNVALGGGQYAAEVFDVRYGDGTEISDVDLQCVREACEANTVELAMQLGDAVYLDNFTVLHGRKPFQGTRKHTVVWCLN